MSVTEHCKVVDLVIPDVSQITRTRRLVQDGEKEVEMETVNGVPHGKYIEYWPSGIVRTQGMFSGGQQAGTWVQWDEDGRMIVPPQAELQTEKRLQAAAAFNKQNFPEVYEACGGF